MAEKSTTMLGEEPSDREIEEINKLKVDIVNQLREADVKFPIKTKEDLANIYPWGTPIKCNYRGRDISIHDIIPHIPAEDFPLHDETEAAIALTRGCSALR